MRGGEVEGGGVCLCAHHSIEIDQMSVWQAATESGKRLLCCFSPLATATALHCMAKAWTVQLQSTGAFVVGETEGWIVG